MANITLPQILELENKEARKNAYQTYVTQMHDISLTELTKNFSINQATMHIPYFCGDTGTSLNHFLQDVDNGLALVPPGLEGLFLRSVITKLSGRARDSLNGHNFETWNALKIHLREHFGPNKSFGEYLSEISTTYMRKHENIQQFHDRLVSLINNAIGAARITFPNNAQNQECKPILEQAALHTFIQKIPDTVRNIVISSRPTNLSEALRSALESERYNGGHRASYNVRCLNCSCQEEYATVSQRDCSPSRMLVPENDSHVTQTKRVNFNDPNAYSRDSVPYFYDRKDTHFPRMTINEGRIQAPPQLSYANNNHQNQPISILKPPNVHSNLPQFQGYYPAYPGFPYYPYPYYPSPPNFPFPHMSYPHLNHSRPNINSRPNTPTENRPNSPFSSGSLNSREARRLPQAMSQPQNHAAVKYTKVEELADSEASEMLRQ